MAEEVLDAAADAAKETTMSRAERDKEPVAPAPEPLSRKDHVLH